MRICRWMLGVWIVCALSPVWGADALALKEGDRLVLLGSTVIEREQSYGHWEAALITAHKDINFTIRNLGWSGDNVWAESRAGFGTPEDGFKELRQQILGLKPTVILVCYGANESYAGAEGVSHFKAGLNRLLNMLAETKARLVLASPTREESLGGKLPDAAAHNRDLELYSGVIRDVAGERKLPYVDLFTTVIPVGASSENGTAALTENGLHLTEQGYRRTSAAFVRALGTAEAPSGTVSTAGSSCESATEGEARQALRNTIVHKNELYFYRWRPQNVTYLFGFRKHEQGNNAKEVAEFDPLVAKEEAQIQKLKVQAAEESAQTQDGTGVTYSGVRLKKDRAARPARRIRRK